MQLLTKRTLNLQHNHSQTLFFKELSLHTLVFEISVVSSPYLRKNNILIEFISGDLFIRKEIKLEEKRSVIELKKYGITHPGFKVDALKFSCRYDIVLDLIIKDQAANTENADPLSHAANSFEPSID